MSVFKNSDLDGRKLSRKIRSFLLTKRDTFWRDEERTKAFALFNAAQKLVPAYRDFLKKHRVNIEKIKTPEDLRFVPHTTKNNYVRKYSLKDRSWGGTLEKPFVFTSTSGSTGEPVFFSRNNSVDVQSSVIHEIFFNENANPSRGGTLAVICFGMGVWIGGIITYQALRFMQGRGYPISIITPGINKGEIFKILSNLAPSFKEILLIGYPPFIKDILDEAPQHGIHLKRYSVRLLFAAEAFTENFRDYCARKVGMKNPLRDSMNIYGSADIGTMSFETPLSILIRRIATKKPKLFNDIFSPITKTPTLTQYIPSFISFDLSPEGEILLTGDSATPLIRYSIGDHGGVHSFAQMKAICKEHDVDLDVEAKRAGIDKLLYELPFVYVYERADLSTTLYGLQIYPETIREVLFQKPFDTILTGKCTIITKFSDDQNQYLEINIEVQKGARVDVAMEKKLIAEIIKNLREKNSEFRELSDFLKEKVLLHIVCWQSEDPLYFKPGIKQKWVQK